jgi:hypothetical protein
MPERQPHHERESHAHNIRSTGVKRRHGRRDRFTTASWCRSAMISRCSETRDRNMNEASGAARNDRRHETRLSENIHILNRRNAYDVFDSHRGSNAGIVRTAVTAAAVQLLVAIETGFEGMVAQVFTSWNWIGYERLTAASPTSKRRCRGRAIWREPRAPSTFCA